MSIAAIRRATERWADRDDKIQGMIVADAQTREGRAYEAALMKERDRLAENRAIRQERRAATEWDRQQTERLTHLETELGMRNKATVAGLEATLPIQAAADLAALKNQLPVRHEATMKIYKEQAALEQTEFDRQWVLRVQEAKDTALALADSKMRLKQIDIIENKYNKASDLYKDALTAWIDAGSDLKSEAYSKVYKAQEEMITSFKDLAGIASTKERPLTVGEGPNFENLRRMTASALVSDLGLLDDSAFNDLVAGLQQGEGRAFEEAMKEIEKSFDKTRIKFPTDEKEKIVQHMLEIFAELDGVETPESEVITPGFETVDGPDPSFQKFGAEDSLDKIAADISVDDVGKWQRINYELNSTPSSGGRANPLRQDLNAAEWRDPRVLLPRLEAERNTIIAQIQSPRRGRAPAAIEGLDQRLKKVESLILQMKSIIQQSEMQNATTGIMGPENMGMIAAVDQGLSPEALAYWEPEAVEARNQPQQMA